MTDQYNPFEENEISIKANGGTELIKRRLASELPSNLTNEFQIICSRVRDLRDDKIRVYWIHDLPNDGETNHIKEQWSRDRFHKIVFCGYWQYNQFINHLNLPYDTKLAVIDNGIYPIDDHEKPTDTIELVYMSSPQRGLEILVPVFTKLVEKYPSIKFNVFSSFNIYGWENADEQPRFKQVFDQCKNHPNIVYHGFKDNSFIREYLKKCHILSYPSIWPECNSIAMMEAMSAGLLCVHPNYAGLSDTCGGLTAQYQFYGDMNTHAQAFYGALDHAISIIHDPATQNYLKFVKNYSDCRFNMNRIKLQWQDLLEGLLNQYPANSRKLINEPVFSYKAL